MEELHVVSQGLLDAADAITRIEKLKLQDPNYDTKKDIDDYLKAIVDIGAKAELENFIVIEQVYMAAFAKKILEDKDYPTMSAQRISEKLKTYSVELDKIWPPKNWQELPDGLPQPLKDFNATVTSNPKTLEALNAFVLEVRQVLLPEISQYSRDIEEINIGFQKDLSEEMAYAKETAKALFNYAENIDTQTLEGNPTLKKALFSTGGALVYFKNPELLPFQVEQVKEGFEKSLGVVSGLEQTEEVQALKQLLLEAQNKLLTQNEIEGEQAKGRAHVSWDKSR
jgi:hypothetical protein